jgi:anthranilate phosphoribosyltransferase
MQTGYGPALLLGVLIGGAILLDDVITPERKGPPPRVAMFHHGDGVDDPKALSRSGDRNVWVIKGDDPVEAEIHKEIRIELASDDTASDKEQLMISVSVDADDEPTGDLAAAIGAVIDAARAEGREPTKEEIEAAVTAIAGDAQSIDVEVLSTTD